MKQGRKKIINAHLPHSTMLFICIDKNFRRFKSPLNAIKAEIQISYDCSSDLTNPALGRRMFLVANHIEYLS